MFLIPSADLNSWLDGMNTTSTKEGRTYWHVQIRDEDGTYRLLQKAGLNSIDLTRYLLPEDQ